MKINLIYTAEATPEIQEILRQKSLLYMEGLKHINSGKDPPEDLANRYRAVSAKLMAIVEEFQKTAEKTFENCTWESSNVVSKAEELNIMAPVG